MSAPVPIVIQAPGAPAPPPASGGKKLLLILILAILAVVGAVYANLNGYITLPETITKYIPAQYLPVTEAAPVEAPAEATAEAYKEEPETYEDEMAVAKYETESYKDEPETYEEEKYVDNGPEAYRPF